MDFYKISDISQNIYTMVNDTKSGRRKIGIVDCRIKSKKRMT
ncbi:hypothetical protein TRIP_D440388 [uncultured Paludibacter sp.]|nr:hypothetical protein TRIP_D440388 [uncultured Paludibacter sp.]